MHDAEKRISIILSKKNFLVLMGYELVIIFYTEKHANNGTCRNLQFEVTPVRYFQFLILCDKFSPGFLCQGNQELCWNICLWGKVEQR